MDIMHPMRRLIALSEAKKLKPRPLDTSGFAAAITAVMRKFVTKSNHGLRFNREWADAALTAFRERKARQIADYTENDMTLPADSEWDELLTEIADKLWNRNKDALISVRRNVEHEEQEYQHRAAERHDDLDDPDFYIESSDYLSGMHAMVQLAGDLQTVQRLSDPQSAQTIIARCDSFIDAWETHLYGGDGGEQPVMDQDFVDVIERLLPLLLLLYTPAR